MVLDTLNYNFWLKIINFIPMYDMIIGKEWSTAGGSVDEMVVKDCEIIDVELLKDTRELTGMTYEGF